MDHMQTVREEAKLGFIIIVGVMHVTAAVIGASYWLSMYQTVGWIS